MKKILVLLLVMLASSAFAADTVPPGQYSMSVARVYESELERPRTREWVFIFGGTGPLRGGETVCRTPEGLKKLIGGLPRGSTLDWYPTCDGESVALNDHFDELKKICVKAGIVFTIHPAG